MPEHLEGFRINNHVRESHMIAEVESKALGMSSQPDVTERLYTSTVRIRRFAPEDAVSLYEATRESISALCAWMVWCHPEYSLQDSRSFILNCDRDWDRGESFSFAIVDSTDQRFLGSAGLSRLNSAHRFANLGYWVRSSRAGQGIASAAVRLAAEFAFRELNLHRLELVVPIGNKPSQRVADKVGAHCEGVMRKRLIIGGKHHDAVLYALLPEDIV